MRRLIALPLMVMIYTLYLPLFLLRLVFGSVIDSPARWLLTLASHVDDWSYVPSKGDLRGYKTPARSAEKSVLETYAHIPGPWYASFDKIMGVKIMSEATREMVVQYNSGPTDAETVMADFDRAELICRHKNAQ